MFNNEKIRTLESNVKFLESERDRLRDRIYILESRIELLANHIGFEFREVPSKTILYPVEKKV